MFFGKNNDANNGITVSLHDCDFNMNAMARMLGFEAVRAFEMVPQVDRVIFRGKTTIVLWEDGTKTVVKCFDEDFDKEKGLAMAFIKKLMPRNDFKRLLKEATTQEIKVEEE